MAKKPDTPKKPGKTPKSKAHRPEVQPIGPALAELLNPAINRGDAGMGSGTGLQPPPDNSWDRRAGGEAAAHRARASTKGTSDDVAKRDASSQGHEQGLEEAPQRSQTKPRPTERRRPVAFDSLFTRTRRSFVFPVSSRRSRSCRPSPRLGVNQAVMLGVLFAGVKPARRQSVAEGRRAHRAALPASSRVRRARPDSCTNAPIGRL